jgi:ribonuclease P protein component
LERSDTHRFTKNNRLLDAASFSRVFDKATRSRDKWFTVLCRHNDLGIARLGLAISKKHCKRAVDRNRIKRIVRESFRSHGAELQGIDLVVMNKVPACDAANNDLQRSLEEHWRRCGNVSNAGSI